jgi:hypothetical protein
MGYDDSAALGGLNPVSTTATPTDTPPLPRPASLIQVAGWVLADVGIQEPSAALLEPLAVALLSLDAAPSPNTGPSHDRAGVQG